MSDISNSATLQLFSLGTRFGRWLKVCVAAFIDELAGSGANAARSRTMVEAGANGITIHERNKAGVWQRVAPLDEQTRFRGRRQDILLRVGSERAVVQRLTLPAGALDVLPAVIRNKVESLAPWPLAEAMWGHRLVGGPKTGQIDIEVGIVSRKTVRGLLEAVSSAGARVAHLEISPAGASSEGIAIDFLSGDRTLSARRVVTGIMGLAAALALAVGGYGTYLAYLSYSEAAALDRRIAELKQSLTGGGIGEGSAKLVEANRLYQRKLETRPAVAVLNALTRALPDGTWLTDLDYSGTQMTIAGRGVEIPRIIELLETSEEFSAVNFAAATQRDSEAGSDSFSIAASVDAGRTLP